MPSAAARPKPVHVATLFVVAAALALSHLPQRASADDPATRKAEEERQLEAARRAAKLIRMKATGERDWAKAMKSLDGSGKPPNLLTFRQATDAVNGEWRAFFDALSAWSRSKK